MIIDNGNSCEGGFAAFWSDSDHLAINGEKLARSNDSIGLSG